MSPQQTADGEVNYLHFIAQDPFLRRLAEEEFTGIIDDPQHMHELFHCLSSRYDVTHFVVQTAYELTFQKLEAGILEGHIEPLRTQYGD